jgi:hypothetical protein
VIVPIRALVRGGQPCAAERVERYREMLRAGSKPPPVRVVRMTDSSDGNDTRRFYLLDGNHRAAAAWSNGATHIHAELVPWP